LAVNPGIEPQPLSGFTKKFATSIESETAGRYVVNPVRKARGLTPPSIINEHFLSISPP
jgi:hypothetical protein